MILTVCKCLQEVLQFHTSSVALTEGSLLLVYPVISKYLNCAVHSSCTWGLVRCIKLTEGTLSLEAQTFLLQNYILDELHPHFSSAELGPQGLSDEGCKLNLQCCQKVRKLRMGLQQSFHMS